VVYRSVPGHEAIEKEKADIFTAKKEAILQKDYDRIYELNAKAGENQEKAVELLKTAQPNNDAQDTNYIFLRYIIDNLPIGFIGFLIAMILLSSMGSMASAFGSLTSTSMVDIYERFIAPNRGNQHYWWISKLITLGWGVLCLVVAQFAVNMGSLIEVVNILGSWFYGTILGIFLCAFYLPRTTGTQVFVAALIAEAFVIYAWKVEWMAFLWLNVLGCLLVMAIAFLLSLISGPKQTSKTSPE
jgi:Na+/proline symporter